MSKFILIKFYDRIGSCESVKGVLFVLHLIFLRLQVILISFKIL